MEDDGWNIAKVDFLRADTTRISEDDKHCIMTIIGLRGKMSINLCAITGMCECMGSLRYTSQT